MEVRGVLWFFCGGGWCVCFQLCFASRETDGTMPGVWSGWSDFWKPLGQGCENISVQSFGQLGNAADRAVNNAPSALGATGDQSVPIAGYQGKGRRRRRSRRRQHGHPARTQPCAPGHGDAQGRGRSGQDGAGGAGTRVGAGGESDGLGGARAVRGQGRAVPTPRVGRPRLRPSPGGAGAV